MSTDKGAQWIAEWGEWAGFPAATQRYIRTGLLIQAGHADIDNIARNQSEKAELRERILFYRELEKITHIPEVHMVPECVALLAPLIQVSNYDLERGKITTFRHYHFLYVRLLGFKIEPFLPPAFMAASFLPHITIDITVSLADSIEYDDYAGVYWHHGPPLFFPDWVNDVKIDNTS